MYPEIAAFKVTQPFKYLWLKYVTGVNLNVHCARCLTGEYSQLFTNLKNGYRLWGTIMPIVLQEHGARYFYLCGVHSSRVYARNFHLAFRYKKGKTLEFNELGIAGIINNAERIPIVPIDRASNQSRHKDNPAYYTCRNWQFANMIAEEINAEN